MKAQKQHLYDVARGAIENPVLTLDVDGESMVFKDRDARIYAFGMLSGIKATEQSEFIVDSNAKNLGN